MDPFTHIVVTRTVVSSEPKTIFAGLAADLPFYLTYPAWLIRRGQLGTACRTNDWPSAPRWMVTLHHLFHSLPVLLLVTLGGRLVTGHWSPAALAWGLHILIDIPTHSRRQWAPQFLWPFSAFTVDGVSWVELILPLLRRFFKPAEARCG